MNYVTIALFLSVFLETKVIVNKTGEKWLSKECSNPTVKVAWSGIVFWYINPKILDAGEYDLRVAVTGGQVCGRQNGRRQNGWHLLGQTADVDCRLG